MVLSTKSCMLVAFIYVTMSCHAITDNNKFIYKKHNAVNKKPNPLAAVRYGVLMQFYVVLPGTACTAL